MIGQAYTITKSFFITGVKNMDLEEVYLRQIDQKLKRQIELQEKNNELLKAILKALSK